MNTLKNHPMGVVEHIFHIVDYHNNHFQCSNAGLEDNQAQILFINSKFVVDCVGTTEVIGTTLVVDCVGTGDFGVIISPGKQFPFGQLRIYNKNYIFVFLITLLNYTETYSCCWIKF